MKWSISNVKTRTPQDMMRTLRNLGRTMPLVVKMIQTRYAEQVIRTAQEEYLNTAGGEKTLRSVTGALSSSLRWWFQGKNILVGTNLVYAAIHEYGGTIKALGDGYLKFMIGDRWISKKQVTMPKRSYISPSIEKLFNTSQYQRIAEFTMDQEFKKLGLATNG